MSTSPMDLAHNVLEGAGNLKNSVFTTVSNLFSGDEGMKSRHEASVDLQNDKITENKHVSSRFIPGGIPDITFDPMKVVTDTVEEFADRRDMFLAYLSNILMEDKGTSEWITAYQSRLQIPVIFN